ncbi:unnamed protein product [Acanthoscelides obtectus]|uniref:Resistance to inhibitors of cholinesterase protein 3 N-terminal domain-containing protein n=1 Tax=Acanthoscelides obtectus TaxID=200917 RepID=A0A9P0JR16_ACAOB|nr:unnamed protein product [Acanthoscelides obtectus]CAK1640230.1 hypothetical protein AOBTE_LOCUS11609 [Acanthoscelides obtectus]
MTDRIRSSSYPNSNPGVMANELSPRKTMFILVIVVGCFAVLWPKVFYPMLVGSLSHQTKPSPIDRSTGCCDVISDMDVDTIKIMSEVCNTIIKKNSEDGVSLTGREIIARCHSAVLDTCGIDISAVLQEQVRLGQTTKQILDQVRSMNGSLCLKYNFGVSPWKLGVPHTIKVAPSSSIRQERPSHLRSEMVHPAFKERGRAIPQTTTSPPSRFVAAKRVVEGRPGPIPAMRPTMGGPGHVVPPPKQGTGSIGLIMPIYTIGIVIFFTYTVMKIIFKKQPESLYPPVDPDPRFRKEVFEAERCHRANRDGVSSKLGELFSMYLNSTVGGTCLSIHCEIRDQFEGDVLSWCCYRSRFCFSFTHIEEVLYLF